MDTQIDKTKLAWLAGIIDGEGSVGIYQARVIQVARNGVKHDITHVVYQLEISNNNVFIIQEVHDIVSAVLGDKTPATVIQVVADKRPERKNSRVNYRVNVKDHVGLIKVLSSVEPYLIGKRAQAQVMLKLLTTHRRHTEYTKIELEIIGVLKAMKKHNTNAQPGNTEPSMGEQSPKACVETIQAQLL